MQDLHRRIRKLTSILDVARAIAAERDLDRLLDLVLTEVASIVEADRCTVFIVDRREGQIWSKIAHGVADEIRLPLGVGIAGHVARSGEIINLADAYADPRFNLDVDRRTGYRTGSLLCVPMKNVHGDVVGVLQTLNKIGEGPGGAALAFDEEDERLLTVLGGQVAVALENAFLYEEIGRLFDGFVRASVVAIESRDPTTAGHSERVAQLCLGLMDAVEQGARGAWAGRVFSDPERMSIRYAALLHDFGKVGVREQVLVKASKLYPWELDQLEARFTYAKKSLEAESLRRRIHLVQTGAGQAALDREAADWAERARTIDAIFDFVRGCNRPAVLSRGGFERLQEFRRWTFPGPDGTLRPLLTEEEVARLSIPRGSLSERELREIQGHVTHTVRFLSQIPWTHSLRRVPEIAAGHHERLDGTGYPLGLLAPQIGIEARMMAIADIYDALTASDRPYKKAVPHDSALGILKEEVHRGQLDGEIFRLFVESEVPLKVFGGDALLRGSRSWPLK